MRAMNSSRAAVYCVANSIYFPGVVALVNSLRLVGHRQPVYILDCGLTADERELLSGEAHIVPAPGDAPPWFLKTVAPLRYPAEVMVLIDADIVVTRPLDELIETAAAGRVVGIEHGSARFFPEWGRLLGLGAPRRQPYVTSSLLLLDCALGGQVLALVDRSLPRVKLGDSPFAADSPEDGLSVDVRTEAIEEPFFFPEQDVLNAVLAAELDRERLVVLDRRLEAIPPFEGLRIADVGTLRCSYEDGLEPYAVHHLASKPWLETTPYGVYTQLFLRVLLGRDVAIRLRPRDLPPHLRIGVRGRVSRMFEGALGRIRTRAR
jgi:hypothetical protein